MRTTVLLFVGWTLLVSLPAYAELRGVLLYERGNYAAARKKLEEELRSKTLSTEERVKARLYLAAALHASGAEEAARIQLEELALTTPDLKVDPILFPPEFVTLAEKARKQVEDQRLEAERQRLETERQRQEAENQRLEAERKAREEELARSNPPPPEEEEEPSPLQLRPELFGYFVTAKSQSGGIGGALTLEFGKLDLSARVLGGQHLGLGAEVGFLLGDGMVQPRLALRGTAIPNLDGFGGGAVVGVRLAPLERFTFLVDVGAEYLTLLPKTDTLIKYQTFMLTTSAGVGFELF